MNEFLAAYGLALGSFTGFVILAFVMFHPAAKSVRFWFMDWWYGLPMIGKIARLSKDHTRASDGEWMNVERTLCADYKQFINFLGKTDFLQKVDYMQHARDLGRTPTPLWAIILLAILVIAEGLGFSYLLGGIIAADGSANTRTLLMVGVVLTICLITVAVMHSAGHNFYRNSLINDCKRSFKEAYGDGSFFSEKIALKDLQDKDVSQPEHVRCANRVCAGKTDHPKYGSIVSAIILMAAIALGSTWMRWSNMEKSMIEENVASAHAQPGNPFGVGTALPPEVTNPQKEADAKVLAELATATKSGNLAGFIMLAVIFVITQLVGIGVGYKYGFGGNNSHEAYELSRGFSTYDSYYNYYRYYIEIASARLQQLQQKLEEDSGNKLKLSKTFHDYIAYANQKDRELIDKHGSLNTAPSPQSSTLNIIIEELAPKATQPIVGNVSNNPVATQLAKLDRITNKDERKEYLKSLEKIDDELFCSVLVALRQRKEEERCIQSQKTKDAELDELV